MPRPTSWRGTAYNPVPDSENRIHSDEVARQHGFEGGLVPGVVVSAYLCHPAVEAWGVEWLTRGRANVVVKKPVYDGRPFRVDLTAEGESAYYGELIDGAGVLCAIGRVELPLAVPDPPRRRGDGPVNVDRSSATRSGMEALRDRGMGSIRVGWDAVTPMTSYLRDPSGMPDSLRADRAGHANPAFAVGLTNLLLAANVTMGPWLHLEARWQNFASIPGGCEVVAEGRVVDLFEKKGHEFVDVEVSMFLPDDRCALTATLRAIYRLRGT